MKPVWIQIHLAPSLHLPWKRGSRPSAVFLDCMLSNSHNYYWTKILIVNSTAIVLQGWKQPIDLWLFKTNERIDPTELSSFHLVNIKHKSTKKTKTKNGDK